MPVSVVSPRVVTLPVDRPMPVVVILGSGRAAKALCQALPTEGFHTILAADWSQVRSLACVIRPDLLLMVPSHPDELAWRVPFGHGAAALTVSQLPGVAGLRWPVRWRTLVMAVRHRIDHAPGLAILH